MKSKRPPTTDRSRARLVVLTTVPESAWTALRGQLSFLSASYEVIFVSSPGDLLDRTAEREGVASVALPMRREISIRDDVVSIVRLIRLFRRLRPDVVLTGTPKAGLLGAVAALVVRVPVRIYLLRGLRLETAARIQWAILWAAEWLACRCSTDVLVVSESLMKRSRELKLFGRTRGRVLGRGASNGVDTERFGRDGSHDEVRLRFRAEHGIARDAFLFGYVGRITRDKGINELMDAFASLVESQPNAAVVLVGTRDAASISEQADQMMTSHPQVHEIGWLNDPHDVYRAIDVLVLPTYREGLPNVVLEAAAAGRPVITTTATGAVDSVLPGRTGLLVAPRSSAELETAMRHLLEDPAAVEAFGASGAEFVRHYYSNKVVWGHLQRFIDEQIAKSTR